MKRVMFSFLNAREGGMSYATARFLLQDAGVTNVRKEESCYIGHNAVSVPKRFEKRASRILFGR